MKLLLHPVLLVLVVFPFLLNQETEEPKKEITLCHAWPSSMADFVNDPEFVKMHPSPLLMDFQGLGQEIKFDTPDGKEANGYFIESKTKSDKWLFVYQEWWGLNDQIRNEADKFYKDLNGKVNVLALDMYDGKLTTEPSEAGKLMQGADQNRLQSIMEGGYDLAGKNAKVASVGWCFGGGLSLRSALTGGKQAIGSVMYYGMPVQDVNQLKTLNTDVLGLFATENWISKEVIEEFAANMKKADKKLTYKIFDAVHGFANPSNAKHDPEATKEAYSMAINYLKGKFKV
ncbi:MAG: dienelactone hydrolase family protein [Cytophagales bacterium]|nr:dienelactone hydrolase family protein [Cytophagales bacterium]